MKQWRKARLEEVADVCGGSTPSRRESKYFGGNIAWATPTDVTALNGLYLTSTKERITEEGLRNSSAKLLPAGAVLLTSRATIGYTAVSQAPITTNQGFVNFVCGPDLVPEFLAYWLRTQKAKMLQHAGGTTFKEIARGTLRKFALPIPPLPKQREMVDHISRAEGIVRLRQEAKQKAAELIPAIFLDMFGDPATNSKGWMIAKVGSLLSETPTLGTMIKPSTTQGEWLDLRVANIQGGRLTLEDKKWLDLPASQAERFALRNGDVVLARAIGSLDHLGKAVVLYPTGEWTFDSHLMRLRFDKSKLLPEVFKGFLESSGGRAAFLKHTRRSAVQFNINGKEIRQIEVPVPTLIMQKSYVTRVKDIQSIQSQQSAATIKAKSTFDALLARTFSNA